MSAAFRRSALAAAALVGVRRPVQPRAAAVPRRRRPLLDRGLAGASPTSDFFAEVLFRDIFDRRKLEEMVLVFLFLVK